MSGFEFHWNVTFSNIETTLTGQYSKIQEWVPTPTQGKFRIDIRPQTPGLRVTLQQNVELSQLEFYLSGHLKPLD
jgi:hypothetical protein